MAKNNQIQKQDIRPVVDAVMNKVDSFREKGELVLPEDYNIGNALNAAYLRIQDTKDKKGVPVSQSCTPASFATALLDMVVQGLDPAKNQCYFIAYGDQLTLMRSYMGTVAAAKRFGGVKRVAAQVVYQGDEFSYNVDPVFGGAKDIEHKQTMANRKNPIIAAYASLVMEDGSVYHEIMDIDQIRKAWAQGATNGKSPAHNNFPEEMAKKTVINRACKLFINTSLGSQILTESFNRTTENDYIRDDEPRVIDVDEKDITAEAFDQIMADDKAPAPAEPTETEQDPEQGGEFMELTDEEKAEIEAEERAAAEAEAKAEQEAK